MMYGSPPFAVVAGIIGTFVPEPVLRVARFARDLRREWRAIMELTRHLEARSAFEQRMPVCDESGYSYSQMLWAFEQGVDAGKAMR